MCLAEIDSQNKTPLWNWFSKWTTLRFSQLYRS